MEILDYTKNTSSQNGEDGIIEHIFHTLDTQRGNFIEFGAWDGKHLSNTYQLYLKGWSGIYIEEDPSKFIELQSEFSSCERVTCLNRTVGYTANDNLDHLIDSSTHLPKSFDFISIDVDGLDYFILEKFQRHLPSVICIEVNAGHSPLFEEIIPPEIAQNNIGQSLKVISDMAQTKGYFPLCYTGNLFLVKNEYKHLFEKDIKPLKDIYLDFLNHLDQTGAEHLYKTFIINETYNHFTFVNPILKSFCGPHPPSCP